ncbi:MAG: hypothetical protein GY816_10845 [Cytophagales bacterium]|nr:hypothetical protein [Cytophagales bacterium]
MLDFSYRNERFSNERLGDFVAIDDDVTDPSKWEESVSSNSGFEENGIDEQKKRKFENDRILFWSFHRE